MRDFDFIAIGDITTDAFIRLENASAHCHLDKGNLELCVGFGDKIPYEFVKEVSAVGNSPNASVCASRLGLKTALVSNLGNDENGQKCLEKLKAEKVNTDFITVHEKSQTNYHYVLWFEDDRTILVKHENYNYKFPDIGNPKWIYLSSIGGGTEKYHNEIEEYLKSHPSVKLAFQPGTFQIRLGTEKMAYFYQRADVLALNKKEAQIILNTKETDNESLLSKLANLGPKIVVMTNGEEGSYTYCDKKTIFTPPFPSQKPPYERTGAGDAYSATFISAIILNKSIEEALKWANVNSMSVIQCVGAQEGLLTQKGIEK